MDGFAISFDSSANQIDEWLRPMCANHGDEAGKRKKLVGTLIELLRKGQVDITIGSIEQILHQVGLNSGSMRNLNQLHETLNRHF